MRCDKCGFFNPEGMNFCGECGNKLVFFCKECGRSNPSDTLNCTACAEPRETWENGFPQSAERKFVTIFFSDLSGYTTISEALPPEEVKKLMSLIFGRIAAVVKRYGGTIDKFIGDAALALFGMPRAHGDDPVRALGAAKEIHGIVEEIGRKYRETLPLPLLLHTGIHTGFVITGEMKRKKRGVTGAAVNLAARLTSIARPGTIVVSDTTRRLTDGHWHFKKLPKVTLKGIEYREALYKAGEPKTMPEDLNGSTFFGRAKELARIETALEKLWVSALGGIVFITGEAGIGKSRLVRQAKTSARGGGPRWLEGRAERAGEQQGYGAFVGILKGFFHISPGKSSPEARKGIAKRLTELFPEGAPELSPVVEGLTGLAPGETFGPRDSLKQHIFRAARKLFVRLSEKKPLVLVLDDLHRDGKATLDLLHHLLPLTETRPLLFICISRAIPRSSLFFRPTAGPAGSPWDRTLHIPLSPLPPGEAAKLAAMLQKTYGVSENTRLPLQGYSGGNPFFIEELFRSLHRKPEIPGPVHSAASPVPPTLRGLILERFDGLGGNLKSLLKAASVVGTDFSRSVLTVVSKKEAHVEKRIGKLVASGFIAPARGIAEENFLFRHALYREVIYDSIPMDEKQLLHRKIAEAYERLFSSRKQAFHGKLAFHFTMAEQWDKAHYHLFKAGEKAGDVAADAEALTHFTMAASMGERAFGSNRFLPDAAVMERKMGEAFFRQGNHGRAMECFLRALRAGGMPMPEGKTGLSLSFALAVQGARRILPFLSPGKSRATNEGDGNLIKTLEAMGWIDYYTRKDRFFLGVTRMLNLAEKSGNLSGMTRGFVGMGMAAGKLGFFSLFDYYIRKARSTAKRLDTPMLNGLCTLGEAVLAEFRGNPHAAFGKYLRSSEIYREAGDMRRWGISLINAAFVRNLTGGFGESLKLADRVKQVGLEGGDGPLVAWGTHIKGLNRLCLGNLDEAADALSKAVRLLDRIPDPYDCIHARASLALCLLMANQRDRAGQLLEETLCLLAQNRIMGPKVALSHAVLGECALILASNREERSSAGRLIRKAVKQAERFNAALPAAYRTWGRYLHMNGETGKAERVWKTSLGASKRLGSYHESAKTLVVMGNATGERLYFDQAESLFQGTGQGGRRASMIPG